MTPPGIHNTELRALGVRLAGYLADLHGGKAAAGVRQALVADLFVGFDDLLVPLKDLVSRPGFEALLEQGKGITERSRIQRDVLLRDLQQIYAPVVLTQVAEVLNGMLGLASDAFSSAVGDEVTPLEAMQAPGADFPAAGRSPWQWLVALLAVGGLGALVALAALRMPPLCRLSGLCGADAAPPHAGSRLQAALAAAQALQASEGLAASEQALSRLEQELVRLRPVQLDPVEQQQLVLLQGLADHGRQRIAALKAEALRLRLKQQKEEVTDQAIPDQPPPERQTSPGGAALQPNPPSMPAPRRVQPVTQAPEMREPPSTQTRSNQPGYSLPPAWEERRERRRQIIENYR